MNSEVYCTKCLYLFNTDKYEKCPICLGLGIYGRIKYEGEEYRKFMEDKETRQMERNERRGEYD